MLNAILSRRFRLALAAALALPLSGCLFRSHKVEVRMSTAALRTATKEEIVTSLNNEAAQIKTVNATVDISPSVGGAKKGKVTEYTDIRGYILVRKPTMLRMIGLFPVVRNRAFDMVSDGQTFRISIPPKNKFILGRNDVTYPSQQGLESLRPQAIFDALLLRPVNPETEIAFLESSTDMVLDPKSKKMVEEPNYILNVIRKAVDGKDWSLARKIYINREDLQLSRQVVYDGNGGVATDARYENYVDYSGILFPSKIEISRPQEEYAIRLDVVKLKFNEDLRDDQFALSQPAGAQLVRLDVPPAQRGLAPAAPSNPPSGQAQVRSAPQPQTPASPQE
jgi:outer membrane lipoprotein-sorting protein